MAAAIRQAARRLAGFVLQRTKTEVPRRLIHGGPPAAAPSSLRHTSSGVELPSAKSALGQDGKASALREIKKKREELFDLIADTERRYDTRLTKEGCQNTRMLQQLAVQIEPRPNDPLWYLLRAYAILFMFLFPWNNLLTNFITSLNLQAVETVFEETQ
ncbi:hypothetical protein VPH35_006599 [Triticum aestivum]